MDDNTHWKKIVSDSKYIGEADFTEGEEKILTVSHIVESETVVTAEGKSQKAVIYWKEPGNKPMILNASRAKAMEKVSGTPYPQKWIGVKFQLYVQSGIKAFGDVVNAVRVRPYKPRVQKVAPAICTDCHNEIGPAMGKDARWVAAYTTKHYSVPLCASCAQKRKEAAVNATAPAPDVPDAPAGDEPESPESAETEVL